jgi:hypothetical protein
VSIISVLILLLCRIAYHSIMADIGIVLDQE